MLECRISVGTLNGVLNVPAVGEARGVGHQLLDGHLTLGRHRFSIDQELHVRQLGYVFRHGVPEVEGAFLIENHRRDGRDRFGHGKDAEQRIGIHRSIILESVATGCLKVNDLSVTRDQRHGAH